MFLQNKRTIKGTKIEAINKKVSMNDAPIQFIRERINEIESALFFNESSNPILLPTCIVSANGLDEDGYIVFFMTRAQYCLPEIEHGFPARLDFYKKGKPFFLKIKGNATIITLESEMGNHKSIYWELRKKTNRQLMLIKVKINYAEYYEMKEHSTWWDKTLDFFAGWIIDKKGVYEYFDRPFSYN
jgi:hypothetical protein